MFTYRPYLYKHKVKPLVGFKKFFVLDFEATCDKDRIPNPQEIIEFPCLAIDGETFLPLAKFHTYVKPTVHPELTSFCTHLTGISQAAVDNSPTFTEVIEEFNKWLDTHFDGAPESSSIFVTCGNWDLRTMLPNQCQASNIAFPKQAEKWINLKTGFFQATGYYPRSLFDMSQHLNIKLHGKLHSGIDDCKNMVRIMSHLAVKKAFKFRQTDTLS